VRRSVRSMRERSDMTDRDAAPAAAELKPEAENFNSDGGDEGDFNSPAPAAAPRAAEGAELERLRIEHAAAVRAVDAGRRLDEPHDSCEEGPGLVDAMMTAYEVWRCVVSGIEIPGEKMAVLVAAAREAARGEGEATP
jgi:hypothetical protein